MTETFYPELKDVRPLPFIKRVITAYIRDDMALYAAALSFHGLLALFPFLMFLLALLSFLRIPQFFDWILEQAATALPEPAFVVVDEVVESIQEESSGTLLSIGAIVAFSVASTGVRALMNALNNAYYISETRALWKKVPLSFLYTIGLAVLVILAGGALALGPTTLEWIAEPIGMSEPVLVVWTWIRLPLLVLILMLIASVVYYVVPNVDQPFRFITPGAIIAVLAWVLATIGFSLYVSWFADYNALYGGLGGIVMLMFYFFISASVLLLGAEINAEVYEIKRGHAVPEDTSGLDTQ